MTRKCLHWRWDKFTIHVRKKILKLRASKCTHCRSSCWSLRSHYKHKSQWRDGLYVAGAPLLYQLQATYTFSEAHIYEDRDGDRVVLLCKLMITDSSFVFLRHARCHIFAYQYIHYLFKKFRNIIINARLRQWERWRIHTYMHI